MYIYFYTFYLCLFFFDKTEEILTLPKAKAADWKINLTQSYIFINSPIAPKLAPVGDNKV